MAHLASAGGTAEAFEEERAMVGVESAPISIPVCVRKPKKKSGKPPKKGKGKRKAKSNLMSRDEMLKYFTSLQNDPNFSMLPFPRFVEESNPELFTGDTPENYREKMKRLDFITALDNAKTDEEREALKKAREKELKQVVPHYAKLPVGDVKGLKG